MTESKYLQPTGYLIAALLIGYGLFSENGIFFRLVSPPTQPVAKRQANPTATPSAPVYTLTQTPIKDIRVGTRVPAYDPQLGTEIRESFAEPNWAQWVKLNLEMTKSDGSLLKMEMLRQEDWVREQIDYQFLDAEDLQNTSLSTAANSSRFLKSLPLEAPEVPLRPLFAELHDVRWLMAEMEAESVLVTISLDLPEIGVRGEAVVTGLEPCPAILPGPGKVVLTTFHHASSDLIDLYLSPQPPAGVGSPSSTHLSSTSSSPTDPLTTLQTSEEALLYPRVSRATSIDPSWERIGVTGNHPIWSQDRHDYVAAMDLRRGERLKNLSGDTVWVQQKLPRPGPTPVYNLEVQDEHVYYVGASGVLAHNVDPNLCVSRSVPNPYGKLGSPAHRQKVADIANDIRARKLRPDFEVPIETVNGKKPIRYMDVVARDASGQIVEVHQVGRVLKTQNLKPVSRERAALRDVRHSPLLRRVKRFFHKY